MRFDIMCKLFIFVLILKNKSFPVQIFHLIPSIYPEKMKKRESNKEEQIK